MPEQQACTGKSGDIESAASPAPAPASPASSHHAPSARLAALVVLAHAAAFWGLFLHGHEDVSCPCSRVGGVGERQRRGHGENGRMRAAACSSAARFEKNPPHPPPSLTFSLSPAPFFLKTTTATAAAVAYEATAATTAVLLAGLWVWSRVAAGAKQTAAARPRWCALSIPALAALFALQWAAFSYLLLSACCVRA